MFHLVCFYATVLLEADRAELLVLDDDGERLVGRCAYGHDDEEAIVGRGFSGAAAVGLATDARSRFVIVPADQRRSFPFLTATDAGHAILATIFGKQGLIGVLAVETKVSGERFTDYDGETLQFLVSQAATAIENAEVYARLDGLVARRTEELRLERDRSRQLLLSILPRDAVDELLSVGKVTPRRFDSATVVFTDFCGFTDSAEEMEPEDLLRRLEWYYERFDQIVERRGLERIKTIGDSYMCVAGVPVPSEKHATAGVAAAVDFAACVDCRRTEVGEGWSIRVGVHSGPVVAGVVGRKRFAYDVWGDTVNVASRMEAAGVPGCVNISAATHELIKHEFTCTARVPAGVKGKGEMTMHLVEADITQEQMDALTEG